MYRIKIKSALISVFYKDNLEPIIQQLHKYGVKLYSTGGRRLLSKASTSSRSGRGTDFLPFNLRWSSKTLHPKIFGGLLARRDEAHLAQLEEYNIPQIDLVIVDLYPFEETLSKTKEESEIIEKIDIGGISLIRAAAKNYKDVVVVSSKNDYAFILDIIKEKRGYTDFEDRRELARRAFNISSHYDTAIFAYFNQNNDEPTFKHSVLQSNVLRYGENPHQKAVYFGDFDAMFEKLGGKEISFNNLVDIDAAVNLMSEFQEEEATFAILKHTNACGVATRSTPLDAWHAALAADPVSAFGGILICNKPIDVATAQEINNLFYEVLIAPAFDADAQALLLKKKQRILLKIKHFEIQKKQFKSILNGVIQQDTDLKTEAAQDLNFITNKKPSTAQVEDLIYAIKCVKHLKSNGISLVKNKQLIAMGCGQTSRVDSLQNAIHKAATFGFDVKGAVMASEAFFPFADCVEIADKAGIIAVAQPGGSIKDQDSIDYCNTNNLTMVMTGIRHFKH